jgi:hypothetical protein
MVGDEAPVDGGEEEMDVEATDEPAEDEEEEEEIDEAIRTTQSTS